MPQATHERGEHGTTTLDEVLRYAADGRAKRSIQRQAKGAKRQRRQLQAQAMDEAFFTSVSLMLHCLRAQASLPQAKQLVKKHLVAMTPTWSSSRLSCGRCKLLLPCHSYVALHMCRCKPLWSVQEMQACGMVRAGHHCLLCNTPLPKVGGTHSCRSAALRFMLLDLSACPPPCCTDLEHKDQAVLDCLRTAQGHLVVVTPLFRLRSPPQQLQPLQVLATLATRALQWRGRREEVQEQQGQQQQGQQGQQQQVQERQVQEQQQEEPQMEVQHRQQGQRQQQQQQGQEQGRQVRNVQGLQQQQELKRQTRRRQQGQQQQGQGQQQREGQQQQEQERQIQEQQQQQQQQEQQQQQQQQQQQEQQQQEQRHMSAPVPSANLQLGFTHLIVAQSSLHPMVGRGVFAVTPMAAKGARDAMHSGTRVFKRCIGLYTGKVVASVAGGDVAGVRGIAGVESGGSSGTESDDQDDSLHNGAGVSGSGRHGGGGGNDAGRGGGSGSLASRRRSLRGQNGSLVDPSVSSDEGQGEDGDCVGEGRAGVEGEGGGGGAAEDEGEGGGGGEDEEGGDDELDELLARSTTIDGTQRDPSRQGGFCWLLNQGHGRKANVRALDVSSIQALITSRAVRPGRELLWDYRAVTSDPADPLLSRLCVCGGCKPPKPLVQLQQL